MLAISGTCIAQDQKADLPPSEKTKGILAITAGGGILTFIGDVGKGKDVSSYTYIRGGYYLNIEKRLANEWLGVSLTAMTGKLAMAERSVFVSRNNNFESSLNQFGLNLTAYLQNNKEMPIPFITAGFAYSLLQTNADKKYNGDSLYHYWSDGSIRNIPELPGNQITAKHVTRDYIYETPIDSAAKNAMIIPVGAGVKMKVGKKLEANLGVTYHITFSDGIDAIKGSGSDKYLFSYFSLTYNIRKKAKTQADTIKSTVDFATIDKLDLDKDGVNDATDFCPGTPKGVQVDGKGCPMDSDEDGVPDYMDKEAKTKKGSLVDSEGKIVTDAMILKKAKQDSLAQARVTIFMAEPKAEVLKQVDADIQKNLGKGTSTPIPPAIANADTNGDGLITSSEITNIIDGFFDGTNDYTVEKIHKLIDFFFEQ